MSSMQTFYTKVFTSAAARSPYQELLFRLSRSGLGKLRALRGALRWEIWG